MSTIAASSGSIPSSSVASWTPPEACTRAISPARRSAPSRSAASVARASMVREIDSTASRAPSSCNSDTTPPAAPPSWAPGVRRSSPRPPSRSAIVPTSGTEPIDVVAATSGTRPGPCGSIDATTWSRNCSRSNSAINSGTRIAVRTGPRRASRSGNPPTMVSRPPVSEPSTSVIPPVPTPSRSSETDTSRSSPGRSTSVNNVASSENAVVRSKPPVEKLASRSADSGTFRRSRRARSAGCLPDATDGRRSESMSSSRPAAVACRGRSRS